MPASEIKTPLTMSASDMAEWIASLTKRLELVADELERIFRGPPPRPQLSLAKREEDD